MKKLGEKNPEMEKWGKYDDQGSVHVFHFLPLHYQKIFSRGGGDVLQNIHPCPKVTFFSFSMLILQTFRQKRSFDFLPEGTTFSVSLLLNIHWTEI